MTTLTVGTGLVFKDTETFTFTFTTSGSAELLGTFLKLLLTVNTAPWQGPRVWSLEDLSSGPGTLSYRP